MIDDDGMVTGRRQTARAGLPDTTSSVNLTALGSTRVIIVLVGGGDPVSTGWRSQRIG